MNRHTVLIVILGSLFAAFMLSCSHQDAKPEATLEGSYTGTATNNANSADKKALSLVITSSSPFAGTYTFNGVSGKITGSVLGLVLNLTLKPDVSGITYTLSATADDNDTTLSGTLTGIESNKAVTYAVVVKK